MAPLVLTDVDLYYGGLDLACYSDTVSVGLNGVELRKSTFCSQGWAEVAAGLRSVDLTATGPQDMVPATGTLTPSVASWSGGIATLTIAGHGLTEGRTITVAGFTPSAWNGTYRVLDVTATTVRFIIASDPGTVTVLGTVSTYAGLDEILGGTPLGTALPFSAIPLGAVEGSAAYFTEAMCLGYTPVQGAVGDLGKHDARWRGRNRLVRGVLASAQNVTATGNGAVHQIGAVSASQRLWSAVHVLSAAGTTPSVTVAIQSDDLIGMGSPTTVLTHTAQTARGGAFASVVGPITDTFYRATWTVSGTAPVFGLRVLIGIL